MFSVECSPLTQIQVEESSVKSEIQNSFERDNHISNIIKYFKLHQVDISDHFLESSLFPKISTKNTEFQKILLFLYFFQSDKDDFLRYIVKNIDFDKINKVTLNTRHNSDGILEKVDQTITIELAFELLEKNKFFSFELFEVANQFSLNGEFMDIIMPLLEFRYYEIPKQFFTNFFSNGKIIYTEKLKWLNSLFKHSKIRKNFQKSPIQKRKIIKLKKFLKKIIISSCIKENAINLINFKEIIQKIIIICLSQNLVYVLNIFALELRFANEILTDILAQQKFYIFNLVIRKHNIKQYLESTLAWNHIFICLNSQENFIQGIYMLYNIKKINKFTMSQHLQLISFFRNLFETEEFFNILLCINPILLIIQLSYLNYRLSKLKTPYFKIYRKMALFLKSCANQLFIQTIYNVNLCELILFKVCFPSSDKLIDILFSEKEFFIEILSQEIVLTAIHNSINPKYQYDYNFLIASSSFLMIKSLHLDYDVVISNKLDQTKINKYSENSKMLKLFSTFSENFKSESVIQLANIFKFLKISRLSNISKTNHIYQFHIFLKSIYLRYIFDFFFYTLTFFFLFFIFNSYNVLTSQTDSYNDMIDLLLNGIYIIPTPYINPTAKKYNIFQLIQILNPEQDTSKMQCIGVFFQYCEPIENIDTLNFIKDHITICADFFNFVNEFTAQQDNFGIACIFSLILGSRFLLNFIYQYKVHKKILFNTECFGDIMITLISIVLIYFKANFWSVPNDSRLLVIFLNRLFCTIIIFFFWLKFFSYFSIVKILAIRFQVIKNMVFDLMSFFFILLFVLLIFATLLFSFFNSSVLENQNFLDVIFSLLGAAFGNFNLTLDNSYSLAYSIILLVFMFFFTIILFNLLIAILSNTYTNMIEKGNMEYGYVLYQNKKYKKYDKKYGALILFPAPLNLFLVPFIFNYLKNPNEFLNMLLVKFGYILMLLLFSILFIVINCIIIPFSWIKILFEIILLRYRLNKTKKNPKFFIVLIHFFIWLIFGLVFLILLFVFHDIPLFFVSGFKICENEINSLPIKDYFFNLFINLIEDVQKKNVKKLTFEEFYKDYCDILEKKSTSFKEKWLNKKYGDITFNDIQKLEIKNYFKRLSVDGIINVDHIKIIINNFNLTKTLVKKRKNFIRLLNLMNLTQFKMVLEENRENFKKT